MFSIYVYVPIHIGKAECYSDDWQFTTKKGNHIAGNVTVVQWLLGLRFQFHFVYLCRTCELIKSNS